MNLRLFYYLPCFTFLVSCVNDITNAEQIGESISCSNDPSRWSIEYGPNDKLGYVDPDGNVMIDYQFSRAGKFENGIAEVSLSDKIKSNDARYFINSSGERVSENFEYVRAYQEQHFFIAKVDRDNPSYFMINEKGETITERYAKIEYKEELGICFVEVECDTCPVNGSKSAMLNTSGEVISNWFDDFNPFPTHHFAIAENGEFMEQRVAAVNMNGEIISDWYDHIYKLSDWPGYYEVTGNRSDTWNDHGLIDSSGKLVVKQRYNSLEYYPNQSVILAKTKRGFDYQSHLISKNFNLQLSSKELPFYFPDNSTLIGYPKSKSSYAYYQMKEDSLIKVTPDFQMESKLESGIRKRFLFFKARAYSKMKYWIPSFNEGFAPVKKGGKYGFIDTNGKLVIDHQFEEVEKFKSGECKVVLKGEELIINTKGEIIE